MSKLKAATLGVLFSVACLAAPARAETVNVYSAGSMRAPLTEAIKAAGLGDDVEVKTTFGGSGLLRERIEAGESPDLFLSADMGHPRKLFDAGSALAPAIAIARNRMCLIARKSADIKPDDLGAALLNDKLKLTVGTAIADPAGDYAQTIIDRVDAAHPGAGAILRAKARHLGAQPNLAPGQNRVALAFQTNETDLMILYCSGAPAIEKAAPDLIAFPFTGDLDVHPVDGMAILSKNPSALRLALFLVSEKGQAIFKEAGFITSP